MLLDLVIVFGLMNTLLKKEILSSYWVLGSPILVTIFAALVTVIFIIARKYTYTLADETTAG
jgi:hypothetical protein